MCDTVCAGCGFHLLNGFMLLMCRAWIPTDRVAFLLACELRTHQGQVWKDQGPSQLEIYIFPIWHQLHFCLWPCPLPNKTTNGSYKCGVLTAVEWSSIQNLHAVVLLCVNGFCSYLWWSSSLTFVYLGIFVAISVFNQCFWKPFILDCHLAFTEHLDKEEVCWNDSPSQLAKLHSLITVYFE